MNDDYTNSAPTRRDSISTGESSARPDFPAAEGTEGSPAGTTPASGHFCREGQSTSAAGSDIPARHGSTEPQGVHAGGEQDPATTKVGTSSTDTSSLPSDTAAPATLDAEPMAVSPGLAAPSSATATDDRPKPNPDSSRLADPTLALLADVLDDLERTRIANENRLRALTRSVEDSDGEIRGFGLDESHPDVARLAGVVDGIAKLEHEATLNLQRSMRKHPLGPWVKATKGIGEKQGARLIASIGDPYIRPEIVRADGTVEPERPRTVSELWAYCGYHVIKSSAGHTTYANQREDASRSGGDTDQTLIDDQGCHVGVAAKRAKGQHANWSSTAKMRAFLVAESCVKKADSPYRAVYDAGREKYENATHQTPCVRCGPAGKPASIGSPLSKGHQHARALRLVSKEVLKDLWRESKRLHEHGDGPFVCDNQPTSAVADQP